MDNTSVLGAVRRRWWIIVLLAVAGGLFGALPEPERVEEQATSFTATHTLLLNDTVAAQTGNTAVSPNQVTLLAVTGEVPLRVAEAIGFDGNAAELASEVTPEFDITTGALTFTTTQDSADQAETIADAFAEETTAYLAERQDFVYQERLAASLERLEGLETELDDLTNELGANPDDPVIGAQIDAISRQYSVAFEQNQLLTENPAILAFTTLQRAQAIENTDQGFSAPTSRTTRGLMGFVAGAAVGVGIAILLGRLDRRIRTREQAEAIMEMRARVIVPKTGDQHKAGGVVVTNERHDPLSDSYRTLRNLISFVHSGLEPVNRARVTVVVSPGPGDGKTSLAANLAAAFVETGQRTIAVNTDFRRPRLATAINDAPTMPLPFIIEDLATLDAKLLLSRTVHQHLLLMDLSSMEASAGELARATARVLPELAEVADAIVVDTSPVGATAEVLDLVPLADVIVVVARIGHTSIEAAARTVSVLRDLTTAPMVLALTGLKPERQPYYEYTDRRRPEELNGDSKPPRWKRRLEKV
jgi:Mrp family chromosome partitioning ATPase